jgi:RNA-binding protein
MSSGALRRALRAAGHHLSPVVQVGKEGATDAVARQLEQSLYDHELVKVKVGTESPEDRFEVAERLAAAAGAQVAQILGRVVLVYKKHPEKPRFEPRGAGDDAPRVAAPVAAPSHREAPSRTGGSRRDGARARAAHRVGAASHPKPSGRARPEPSDRPRSKRSGRARPEPSGRARPESSGRARPKPSGRARPKPSGRPRPKPSGRPRPKPSGRGRPKR